MEGVKIPIQHLSDSIPSLSDNRHDVSDRMLETLRNVSYKQDDYGIEKYKTNLKHTQRYDWLQMFLEEMADGLKYIQNEMDRKQQFIQLLEFALSQKNPQSFIWDAIKILKTEGTGK